MRMAGLIMTALAAASYLYPPLLGRRALVMSLLGKHERYSALAALGLGMIFVLVSLISRKPKSPVR